MIRICTSSIAATPRFAVTCIVLHHFFGSALQALQQQLLDRLAGQASAKRSTSRCASEVTAARQRVTRAVIAAESSRDALAHLLQDTAEAEVCIGFCARQDVCFYIKQIIRSC